MQPKLQISQWNRNQYQLLCRWITVNSVCNVLCKGWQWSAKHPPQHVESQSVDDGPDWQCWTRNASVAITVTVSVGSWQWHSSWQTARAVLHSGKEWLVQQGLCSVLIYDLLMLLVWCTTTLSQHARLSGVLRRRSDGLECVVWRPPRPVAQCRQFQEDAKDASVSECTWTLSTLEALRNALYKFKTYLLTYISLFIDGHFWWRSSDARRAWFTDMPEPARARVQFLGVVR